MNPASLALATVLAASGTAHAFDCIGFYTQTESSYSMTMCLEAPCQFSSGSGIAFAFAAGSHQDLFCNEPTRVDSDGDVNTFSGFGSTSAGAFSYGFEGSAWVSLSPSCLSIAISTKAYNHLDCAECGGLTTGGGSAGVRVQTSVDCEWSISITIEADTLCYDDEEPISSGEFSAPDVFFASYLDTNGNPASTIFGSRCSPATAIGCNDSGTAAVVISGGPGPISFGVIPQGELGFFDVNGDGRINILDVSALSVLLPHTVSGNDDPLRVFDFDGDGTVDAGDLLVYASLVDLLDQGVAGDANGDGVVDCDDLAAVLAHPFDPAISSCHPDYRIEFDWDLDGDNDLEDRMNILRAIQPADFDGNGVINFFDLNLFLDEYNNQTPAGDFNGDGVWNIFDINAFLDAYNNPC